MNPRDSIPTTRSIPASRYGRVKRSTAWRKAAPSLVRVVMSLNRMPGWGKSGTSRMRAPRSISRASVDAVDSVASVSIARSTTLGRLPGEAEPPEVQGGDEGAADEAPLQGDVPAQGAHIPEGLDDALGEAEVLQGPGDLPVLHKVGPVASRP